MSHLSAPPSQEGHKGSITPLFLLTPCLTRGRGSVYICPVVHCTDGGEALDKQPRLPAISFLVGKSVLSLLSSSVDGKSPRERAKLRAQSTAAVVTLGRQCHRAALNHVLGVGGALSCSHRHSAACPRGQRQAMGCHSWLALGFLWTKLGAGRAKG